jgi:hypothetical protein
LASLFIFNKIVPLSTLYNRKFYMGLMTTTLMADGTTKVIQITAKNIGLMSGATIMAAASLASMLLGMNMIISGKDDLTKAVGAMILVFSLFGTVLWQAAVAATSVKYGILAIGIIAATAAAGIWGWTQLQKDIQPVPEIPGSAIGGFVKSEGLAYVHSGETIVPAARGAVIQQPYVPTERTEETTYFDNRTINVYEVNKSDLERVMRAEGKL